MNRPLHENAAAAGSRPLTQSPVTSDAELVRSAWRGDKRAFVEIVARHQAMVCGIALGVLGDFAASEDAAQEAFLTAWRKIHDLREPERLRGWLGQIARHAALGHLRRQRGHDPLEGAPDLPDEAPAPDELAASEEEAVLVRDALAKMPETYREPLILYYREHQSVKAVAEALNLSEDAVKQRLARGREMLRDRMSGLIERVLVRTAPGPIFTMAIAVAIGALAAPAAVAAGVFTAAAAATATTTTSSSSLFTLMSTSKALLITAALVVVACIPVGYQVRKSRESTSVRTAETQRTTLATATKTNLPPAFENSAIFAEWKKLHETYGTSPEAMPEIYQAIVGLKDPFRRRAFRAALIAEWVQVDPTNGLAYFMERRNDAAQRRQFFDEWLAREPRGAVDTLLKSGAGWQTLARSALPEIARLVPERLAEIAVRLPKVDDYWDNQVCDAFAIVAGSNLASTRTAAEAMTGPNREQALAGVAKGWARTDLDAAITWVKALPDGVDRDEIIRGALLGQAEIDPAAALDHAGLVPPGGRQGYFASTTGARILKEASKTDFDATTAWLAAHPGRFSQEDLIGMSGAVTDFMNADAKGFLDRQAASGSLASLIPAIQSALLNQSSGQGPAVWEWLKTQPLNDATRALRSEVLSSSAWQDPISALRMANDLPRTTEGDQMMQTLAQSLLNGGRTLGRFDAMIEQAPERIKAPLVEAAFNSLSAETLNDPAAWIKRLDLLPDSDRGRGVRSLAAAWADHAPENAMNWVSALPAGDARDSAVGSVLSTWAAHDSSTALAWATAQPAGEARDRAASSLVPALVESNPQQAWDCAVNIGDPDRRLNAAIQAVSGVAGHDPVIARHWIEGGAFSPEARQQLQTAFDSAVLRARSANTTLPIRAGFDK